MAPAPVILGLPGAWAEDPLETSSHYTDKVGGVPSWSPAAEALDWDEQLKCQVCGRKLGLVVQAYAPLHLKGREIPERTLYVFGCLASDCSYDSTSWRVFRVQGEDASVKPATTAHFDTTNTRESTAGSASDSWCQDDSWGGAPSKGASSQEAESENHTRREAICESGGSSAISESQQVTRGRPSDVGGVRWGRSEASELDRPREGRKAQHLDGQDAETGAFSLDTDARNVPDSREGGRDAEFGAPGSDEWGADDSWGTEGTSEWAAGSSALDMSALSKSIAEAADAANKRAESPNSDDVSGGGVTSAVSSGLEKDAGMEERAASGAGASVLPCFYIVAGEEAPEKKRGKAQVSRVVDEGPGEESWEGEGYEYDSARSADRTFLRFRKRVERAPEQCVRYGFQSQPLLARALTAPPPPCPACGAPRTFEMQLMPPLPYFLAEASEEAARQVAGWEWLTLLVYTCSEACTKPDISSGDVAVCEEVLVYQHEIEDTRTQPQSVQ